MAVGLGQDTELAPGQAQASMLCAGMWVCWLAGHVGRPGSGSKAQRGGVGTVSSRRCCDRDMRMRPPDTTRHRAFAEFANEPARLQD